MSAILKALSSTEAEAREQRLRLDLAAVFRIAARLGWNEQIGNHNSLMLPEADTAGEKLFLINPRGFLFQEISASRLIVCDLSGRVVRGAGELRRSRSISMRASTSPAPTQRASCTCIRNI